MRMKKGLWFRQAALLVLVFGVIFGIGILSACAPKTADVVKTETIYVDNPIPIPDFQDEEIVATDVDEGLVWVPGWWDWDGDWEWVPGAWVVPMDEDAVWVPGHWQQTDSGNWRWVTGCWMIG